MLKAKTQDTEQRNGLVDKSYMQIMDIKHKQIETWTLGGTTT